MQKKRIAIGTLSVLLTGLLASCGGPAAKGTDTKGAEPPKAVSNEPVELVMYSIGAVEEKDFNDKYGDRIRAKFPNYKIRFIGNTKGTSLNELLAAGTTIDIYYDSVGQFMEGLVQNKMQFDMTDLLKKHNVDLGRFEPTTIDAIKAISGGNAMYGLPITNLTLSLYYNKDIFDKFGVPYLKDGMTWDQVLEVSRKLTRTDGMQYVGLAVSPAHVLRLNPYSLPYVDPKSETPTILNEKWKQIFENSFIKPAQAPGYVEKMKALGNKLPAGTAFTKEKDLAMYIGLNNIFTNAGTAEEMSSMNWDMVSVPTYSDLPGVGSQTYPVYFAVTSTSKQKDAAMEVIKFLVSDEVQMEYSKNAVMTVLKSDAIKNAYGQNTRFKDKNIKSIFFHKFAPISPKTLYDASAETIYRKDLVDLALGTTDINTAFRKAEEATAKAITDAKKK